MNGVTAYALIWMSCSAAAITGIIVTGGLAPLWVFLFPALISFQETK